MLPMEICCKMEIIMLVLIKCVIRDSIVLEQSLQHDWDEDTLLLESCMLVLKSTC